MIGDYRPITLKVTADAGSVTSREAVSLGLIVTELILNALKHAFPEDNKPDRQDNGSIRRGWNKLEALCRGQRNRRAGWRLRTAEVRPRHQHRQCARATAAKVEVLSSIEGTTVSVSHSTFSKRVGPACLGFDIRRSSKARALDEKG